MISSEFSDYLMYAFSLLYMQSLFIVVCLRSLIILFSFDIGDALSSSPTCFSAYARIF